MLRIVLDTNVLLVSISDRSPHHWIYHSFLQEKYHLLVTTDILSEYHEIIALHMGSAVADSVLLSIENAVNVSHITSFYRWNLIYEDADDNKFTDCAIAGNSDYLVSEDRHFDVLKGIDFPSVGVLGISAFQKIMLDLRTP